MRGVRFTAGERDLLDLILAAPHTQALATKPLLVRYLTSIRNKLAEACEPTLGVHVQPLEQALILAANHKVVPLLNGHERASRQAGSLLCTIEDMSLVGEWMLRQSWLTGKFTILDVLNKWSSWYAKAISDRDASKGPKKGIGNGQSTADTGQNINRPSQAVAVKRPTQGFR